MFERLRTQPRVNPGPVGGVNRQTMSTAGATAHGSVPGPAGRYALPVGLGLGVAAVLYVIGTQAAPHVTPADYEHSLTDVVPLKSWLATALLALAAAQVGLALWIYGKLPSVSAADRPAVRIHRGVGILAVALSIPIALHCVITYGVHTDLSARVAVHSIAGCFLYGAIVAKLLVIRLGRYPRWVLPLAGGTVVTLIAVLWYTAALWYFNGYSLPLG
jgi:Family of unknown function (DUF6529)